MAHRTMSGRSTLSIFKMALIFHQTYISSFLHREKVSDKNTFGRSYRLAFTCSLVCYSYVRVASTVVFEDGAVVSVSPSVRAAHRPDQSKRAGTFW